MSLMLGSKYFVSPDAGALMGLKGWVEFYVNDNVGYAIEVVREHDRLQEHVNRFASSGKYARLFSMPSFKTHAIVNFHHQSAAMPALPAATDTGHLYHVSYTNQCDQFMLFEPNKSAPTIITLMGDQQVSAAHVPRVHAQN